MDFIQAIDRIYEGNILLNAPYEGERPKDISEESSFYQEEYGVEGVVFATDGAGDPYILKPDGRITCLEAAAGEEWFLLRRRKEYGVFGAGDCKD